MVKLIVTIKDLVMLGYPEHKVRQAVNSKIGKKFAHRTSPQGKWLIDYKKWCELWEKGIIERL